MKICISSDPYYPYPSGVSEYTFYLAKYLRRFGHDVMVLTTHYPGETPEQNVYRVGRVAFIPMNKSFATLSTGMEIPRRVKDFLRFGEFDILHINGPFPPSISFFALHYSMSVNISTFHTTGFKYYRTGSSLFRTMFKKYNDKLHGFIAVSTTARDTFAPYMPGDYRIIPNGIDIERFNSRVPRRQDLDSMRPKILYLGRLDRRKGLIELLLAMPRVRKEIPDIQLVVVGRGPLEADARKLAQSLQITDSVIFKGFARQDEIPSYYASCDLYCSPALGGESFGIVLLESMAVGTPVAASRISGYDQVINDGKNGILFNPRDPADIAQKMIRILTEKTLRDRLIQGGNGFIKDYSWEKVAKKIEALYYEKMQRKVTKNLE